MRERAQRFDPRQHMHRPDFEVFHYRDPRPAGVEVHHHDFYEVYFFLSGEVDYWVEGRVYHLQPGDLLLINPMELHRPIVKAGSEVYERIVLWIDKGYLERLGGDTLARCFDSTLPTHVNLLRPTPVQRSQITARLGELVREHYTGEYGGELCAAGILLQFMVMLNRLGIHYGEERSAGEDTSPLVSRVLIYISEHYREELSLESLAARFFVSKYHLSHEFSRAVGIGVYRYVMLKRLLIAKQLLVEGTPPGEVYALCGFRDYTNFYRAFKAEYGISPRACGEEKG